MSSQQVWFCKIGMLEHVGFKCMAADLPMRIAIEKAFQDVTGSEADFLFSGWGGKLEEIELAVVENRRPNPELAVDWQSRALAAEKELAEAKAELERLRGQQVMGRVHNDENQGKAWLNSIGRLLPDNTPLYAEPKPSTPAPFWLIEKQGDEGAMWLTITTFNRKYITSIGDHFTLTAIHALKFYDQESANEYMRHNKIIDCIATEHIFVAQVDD